MALRNPRDNAAVAGLLGQFTRRPMPDGTPRRLRRLTGQGDDLAPLLGTERRRRPWSRCVLEALRDGTVVAPQPVAAPAPHRGARRAEAACDRGSREALRQQEDHLSTETEVLGRFMRTYHRM